MGTATIDGAAMARKLSAGLGGTRDAHAAAMRAVTTSPQAEWDGGRKGETVATDGPVKAAPEVTIHRGCLRITIEVPLQEVGRFLREVAGGQ